MQIMNNNPIFDFIDEKKYLEFVKQELEARKTAWYPPFCKLINIELRHKIESTVEIESTNLAALLKHITSQESQINVLGPALPIKSETYF